MYQLLLEGTLYKFAVRNRMIIEVILSVVCLDISIYASPSRYAVERSFDIFTYASVVYLSIHRT